MTPWERFERRFLGKPPAAAVDTDGMLAFARGRCLPVARDRRTGYRKPARQSALHGLRSRRWPPRPRTPWPSSTSSRPWSSGSRPRPRPRAGWETHIKEAAREGRGCGEGPAGLPGEGRLPQLRGTSGPRRPEADTLVDGGPHRPHRAHRQGGSPQSDAEPRVQSARELSLVIGNTVIQNLRTELSDLQKEYSQALGDAGGQAPRHGPSAQLDSYARKRSCATRCVTSSRSVETEYRTAASQEASLQASLEVAKQEALEVNRKAIEFGVLKREVETNQQLYKELLTRNKQTGLEQELETTNIRIVERAEVPRAPISPQRTRNYQLALLDRPRPGHRPHRVLRAHGQHAEDPRGREGAPGLPFLGMVPDVGVKSGGQQLPAAVAPDPEESPVGGGRGLSRAAHEPHLLVGREERVGRSW